MKKVLSGVSRLHVIVLLEAGACTLHIAMRELIEYMKSEVVFFRRTYPTDIVHPHPPHLHAMAFTTHFVVNFLHVYFNTLSFTTQLSHRSTLSSIIYKQ